MISIIIPARKYDLKVESLINALLKQKRAPNEIILVVKNHVYKIKDNSNIPVRIFLQKGKGPANARNLGAHKAKGEIFVFIDSDCLPVNENWLSLLLSDLKDSDVVFGRIIIPGNKLINRFIRAVRGLGTPDYGEISFFVKDHFISFPATNMAIRRKVFEKIGGFDEKLLIAEDVDLVWRLWKEGISIKYNSKAVIFHYHRTSLLSLLKHAFNSGNGSIGFLKKYGFLNRFLKGTFLATVLTLFIPIFFLILLPRFLILVVIIIGYYLFSFLHFLMKREPSTPILTILLFPLLLSLYSLLLGLGVWYGYFAYILKSLAS